MANPNQLDCYLNVPYVDGGRTMAGFDCWGLVRDILHHHYQQPLLESFGSVLCDNKEGMTHAYQKLLPEFPECAPQGGCIVACFKRGLMIHVGIVVEENGLQVYHTCHKHGPLKTRLSAFKLLFFEVKYYAYNPRFSEQAG